MVLRKELFEVLINELNNYDYCILRNYESLPDYSNDIDILIEKNCVQRLIIKLTTEFEKEAVIYLYSAQFSCLAVYFYDTIRDQFIHLDFFEEIKWKIFEYLPANEILKTRIKYNSFFVPNPSYEMNELLLTRLIYQGKIKEVYKAKIINLYYKQKDITSFQVNYNFDKEIAAQSWNKIENGIFKVRTKIIFRNLLMPISLIKNSIKFIYRISKRFTNPPGLFIAFYGADGSGKTTQIRLLLKIIEGLYSDKIKIFHFRPNMFYSKPKDIIVSNPHNQEKTNFIRSFLKLLYYIVIYNWGFLTQILPFVAKNGLVVFDRYYLDLLIDPIRYRMTVPSSFIKLAGKLIPKPDINFALVADSHIIFKRKNEVTLDQLNQQQTRIVELLSTKNDYILQSNFDESKTSNEIKQVIIEKVRQKN